MKNDELGYIVPSLRRFAVPLDTLVVDPANARKHGRPNLDAIARSLKKFKQRLPVVVQKQGMIVRSGNGRVMVARELGWTHIAALVVDESDAQAVAFAIADNRTAELAEWDSDNLSSAVISISNSEEIDVDELLEATGLSSSYLALITREDDSGTPYGGKGSGFKYKEQFGVVVMCKDEKAQQEAFEFLVERGYECKVVTV